MNESASRDRTDRPRGSHLWQQSLEVESDFAGVRARRNVVCAAERGQVVVQRLLVGKVDYCEASAPTEAIAMEEIVVANSDVQQAARLNSLRIVIVIFLTRCRNLKIDRTELICRAGSHGGSKRAGRSTYAPAREPGLKLLVRS